ncbi:hypothetical protein Vretimale_12277 [Volvox reticuliferus]|uniref:SRR1-like domain-containing protein n=1 Tax=Volvox reticuliferus TaxID=1737510 RepID=A0A8J4GJB5_9CHLO|nr:hypothetical protein Vretifemale_8892 [Volvox reticuliferus]GIM08184.1 hypothetical protein Vretimale_12277 [Volvox reticuliferus]
MRILHPTPLLFSTYESRHVSCSFPAASAAPVLPVPTCLAFRHGTPRCRNQPCLTVFGAASNHGTAHASAMSNRTLYGSRSATGQQFLRLLLEAPDIGLPQTPVRAAFDAAGALLTAVAVTDTEAPAPGASSTAAALNPTACLDHVASLVHELAALMASHRDMATLRHVMETCQARANTARAGSCIGGSGGATSLFGARLSSGRSSGVPPSVPTFPTMPFHGTAVASRGSPYQTPPSVRNSANSGSLEMAASTGGPASQADSLCSEPASGDCNWDWQQVRRVVVVGLGSLGSYQAALRSGRQTERESSRAASRLYQLALSLVLASPATLQCRGDQQSRPSVTAPKPASAVTAAEQKSLHSIRAQAAAIPSVATTAPDSCPPVADGGQLPHPVMEQVLYFDPEYLEWDIRLIEKLWHSPVSNGHGPPLQMEALGGADKWREPLRSQGQVDATTEEAPPTQRLVAGAVVTAAATTAPPAALTAYTPTLFYAPCCPREVYDEIVRHNLAAGTLRNVALVGNSLRAQAETSLLLRAFGGGVNSLGGAAGMAALAAAGIGGLPSTVSAGGVGGDRVSSSRVGQGPERNGQREMMAGEEAFVELVACGRVVEVMMPDFAAHGVAIALHLFL